MCVLVIEKTIKEMEMKKDSLDRAYQTPSTSVYDLIPEGILCKSVDEVGNEGYEWNDFGDNW